MDSINISNLKAEKLNSMKKHRQLQKMAKLLRLIELFVVLALVSRFSIHLPVAVRNSGVYFKDLSIMLVSPRFVFVLGNVIVITLFAKSGQFSGHASKGKSSRDDLYQELLGESENSQVRNRSREEKREKQKNPVEFVVTNQDLGPSLPSQSYHRSHSEKFERPTCSDSSTRQLRRSVTEKGSDSGNGLAKNLYPEDNMSNEEFRCTIEAFIARQKRFRIDEEKSV